MCAHGNCVGSSGLKLRLLLYDEMKWPRSDLFFYYYFQFYFLFIFFCYFCFIFLLFSFLHFAFFFILVSFFPISILNFSCSLFFSFYFILFYYIFFISFCYLKRNQTKNMMAEGWHIFIFSYIHIFHLSHMKRHEASITFHQEIWH